ncbi:hypothetical protein FRT60_10490 [Pseudomonas haemolytica]|uniref:Uncharacterized protein n=1 Tax=Pseudomonas haemolytica TaxID=2600065 RepID=A0A646NZH0_9PSED|nr:hypothetical protein [Pseudomonas haemolytica]
MCLGRADTFVLLIRASSRASPLPHLTKYTLWNAVKCGSGLAREGNGPDATAYRYADNRAATRQLIPGPAPT